MQAPLPLGFLGNENSIPNILARLLRVRGYENGFRNGRFGVRNGRVGVRNGRVGVRNGRFGVRNGRFGDRNGRFGFRMGTKTIGYENDGKWRAKEREPSLSGLFPAGPGEWSLSDLNLQSLCLQVQFLPLGVLGTGGSGTPTLA